MNITTEATNSNEAISLARCRPNNSDLDTTPFLVRNKRKVKAATNIKTSITIIEE
jgi:hypothetical protein